MTFLYLVFSVTLVRKVWMLSASCRSFPFFSASIISFSWRLFNSSRRSRMSWDAKWRPLTCEGQHVIINRLYMSCYCYCYILYITTLTIQRVLATSDGSSPDYDPLPELPGPTGRGLRSPASQPETKIFFFFPNTYKDEPAQSKPAVLHSGLIIHLIE